MPEVAVWLAFHESATCRAFSAPRVGLSPRKRDMSLSLRLKGARAALGLSQTEIAARSGVPVGTIRKYEQGPSLPGAEAIEAFVGLGINANWLLTGEGDMLLAGPRPEVAQGAAVYNREGGASLAQEPGRNAQEPVIAAIDGALLRLCWGACSAVHGAAFSAANQFQQLEHAVELYNLLQRLAAAEGQATLEAFARLDVGDLAQQLRIFIKMGRARRFPLE